MDVKALKLCSMMYGCIDIFRFLSAYYIRDFQFDSGSIAVIIS